METLETLRKMRERLEKDGWIKGKLIRTGPERMYWPDLQIPRPVILPAGACLQGACLVVSGWDVAAEDAAIRADELELETLSSVAATLARVIREQFPERELGYSWMDDWDTVTSFNDAGATTLEDVYLVIDKAIAREAG